MLLAATGCSAEETATASAVGNSTRQGSLRAANPTLAYDASKNAWLSLSDSEDLAAAGSKACNGSTSGRYHVPYRLAPTPSQFGDCWQGDVMPSGPGSWASAALGPVQAPSSARIGSKWVIA